MTTPIARPRATSGTYSAAWTPSRLVAWWSISGSSSTESTRSLRRRSSTLPAFDPVSASSVPTIPSSSSPSAAATRSSPSSGSAIRTSRALTSSWRCRAMSPRSGSSSSSETSASPISFRDWSWRSQRVELVQARVLDRDRCLRGEEPGQLGVVLREARAALLLGEVEVAVRNPRSRIGTPRNERIGGCPGGSRPSGSSAMSSSRRGRASWMRTPRMPGRAAGRRSRLAFPCRRRR